MTLRFLRGYWSALRILPISAKALLILGYALSGIVYWSTTVATPGSSVGCVTGPCSVTLDQVQTTRFLGIGLLGMVTVFFVGALTAINFVMDKHPDRAAKLLGPRFDGVSTQQFWNQISRNSSFSSPHTSKRVKLVIILLWIFTVCVWTFLLPSVNPDSFGLMLIASAFVTLGTALITLGTIGARWLHLEL